MHSNITISRPVSMLIKCVAKWIIMVCVLCMTLALDSCSGGKSFGPDNGYTPLRYVSLNILSPPGEIINSTQSYYVVVCEGESDNVPSSSLVNLVEIDPGDGTGWHDITAFYFAHMIDTVPQDTGAYWPYTFPAPGTYNVFARARYYEGEVVTSNVMPTTVPAPAGT
jgi:hypothetical protein